MPTRTSLPVPLMLMLLMCVPFAAQAQNTASRGADEQAIAQLNLEALTAFDKGDAKTLDRIEADDFTIATDQGIITKADHLKGVRGRAVDSSPIDRTITDQKIRFYGDAAIVTEIDHAAGTGGKSQYQTTSVWARGKGTWRIVHLHYSQLSNPS